MNTRTPLLTLLLFLFLLNVLRAQNTQTIRGVVLDAQSELPLIGVAVEVLTVEPGLGGVTDLDGRFAISEVLLGRHDLQVSYLGYETRMIPNVTLTAGKEVYLNLSLEESVVKMDEIVVTADIEKDRPNNDMAAVSTRSFNLEEVNRFSGGRNDVGRLVGNFAGVAVADDSRNDIVVRGNSPSGVLWRLEGVPIPNPNHFSTLGTTGGPVSAINPNLLRRSDFLTSAFPSEYGNALSGVFDLGFRAGNRERMEYTLQLAAFSGLEAMIEGPLNAKKTSSFVLSYRHSFVEIADELGIPVGTNATPNYRDLSFKADFGKGPLGKFSVFGISGTSDIDFLAEEVDESDLFSEAGQDAFVKSDLGIFGIRHNVIVGDNAYIRTVASFSSAGNQYDQYNYEDNNPANDRFYVTDVDDQTDRWVLSSYYNKKYNAQFTLRTGFIGHLMQVNTRVLDRDDAPDLDEDGKPDWQLVRDFDGNLTLLEAYAQGRYRFNEAWVLNAGLHSQYLDESNQLVFEPRAAVTWQFAPRQSLNFGYGLHHQMQPLPVFFFTEETAPGVFERTNADLNFTRAHHFVLGYDRTYGSDWHSKIELYYQRLDQVPVEPRPSSFSMLNAGADFIFPEIGSLVNQGSGFNYGAELTLEKFFSKSYYGLLTASVFDSKYEGSDEIERNTAFNNGYVINLLGGKEFSLGKAGRNAFAIDTKFTTAGGRYYTPIDLEASEAAGKEILDESQAFSERFDPYLRLDLRIGIRLNSKTKRLSQQFFLDFQNLTNNENIFELRYNEETNSVDRVLQAGFFPDILYRIQF